MDYLGLFLVVLQLLVISTLWKVFYVIVWRPYALTKWFEKQGIRGPGYSLVTGSMKQVKRLKKMATVTVMAIDDRDIIPRVFPHYCKWLSQYGETFLYWDGIIPKICITAPELAKEIVSNKFSFFHKPKPRPSIKALLGQGLIFVEGTEWVRHKRALSPAFNIDRLKMMSKSMAVCTLSVLKGWQEQVIQAKDRCSEIELCGEFNKLTSDIISHTAFGTSYIEGKEVFDIQMELQNMAAVALAEAFIPGSQYLPTKWNIRTWKLERRMRNKLKNIIVSRLKSVENGRWDKGYGDDLLGVMLGVLTTESNTKVEGVKLKMDEIMDECKTFFISGRETTSHLLTWTMLLLSINMDWQQKLRDEVLQECGMGIPDADKLGKLKLVHMVLLEALRLYSPVIIVFREATAELKVGNLIIPKGTRISIPLPLIHRNKKYWGEDADEFNPMRFAGGAAKAAQHPNALLAFSVGPRACIGQNLAMMEGKMVLALILQSFSFSLSPKYKHAPVDHMTLQPQFGLPVLLKPLQP